MKRARQSPHRGEMNVARLFRSRVAAAIA